MRWTPRSATAPPPAPPAAPPSASPAALAPTGPDFAPPPFRIAVRRGLANRCPFCGIGRVFAGYLRVVPACSHCQAPLGLLRADDAPPYFVIFLVGHLLVPPVFWVERAWEPPMWLHMVIWLPLFAIACTVLLRPVKGAVVGWMSTLGFVAQEQQAALHRAAKPAGTAAGASGRPHA